MKLYFLGINLLQVVPLQVCPDFKKNLRLETSMNEKNVENSSGCHFFISVFADLLYLFFLLSSYRSVHHFVFLMFF